MIQGKPNRLVAPSLLPYALIPIALPLHPYCLTVPFLTFDRVIG